MMVGQMVKGGKKNRKWGRAARKPKTARYKSKRQRECNKLKRILQSNGAAYAKRWATERNCSDIYRKLV